MINYTEKGIGLHEAINKAGYSLYQHNGSWVASDVEAVQKIIDEYVEPEVSEDELQSSKVLQSLLDAGVDYDKALKLTQVWEVL